MSRPAVPKSLSNTADEAGTESKTLAARAMFLNNEKKNALVPHVGRIHVPGLLYSQRADL